MTIVALTTLLLAILAALAATVAAWAAMSLRNDGRRATSDAERMVTALRDEAAQTRRENADLAAAQRRELGDALGQFGQVQSKQVETLGLLLAGQLEGFSQRLDAVGRRIDERQQAMLEDARAGRGEQAQALQRFGETLALRLGELSESNAQRMNELRQSVETRLAAIQADNTAKLEEMRRTVDEKLSLTLEARLGEAFTRVSERLEQVQRGLGEMQSLAAGVDGLKRVLTGVKTRGMWGEVQLGSLLEQVLVADQYEANRITRPGSNERVEFAIKLP